MMFLALKFKLTNKTGSQLKCVLDWGGKSLHQNINDVSAYIACQAPCNLDSYLSKDIFNF